MRIPTRYLIGLVVLATASLLGRGSGSPEALRVRRVIDGDTITLQDGRTVRYIGIDTPETRRRVGQQWVSDPEPYGRAATQENARLIKGRDVRLEYDVQTHDRFGRLLAYVYVATPEGREVMVNEELLRRGYAQPLTIPPNVKYAERFRLVSEEARTARRGLWSWGREP